MGEVLSLTGILHLVFHAFMRIESFPIINEKVWHKICASVTMHFQPLSSLFRICRRFTVSVPLPYHQSTKRQITYLRKHHYVNAPSFLKIELAKIGCKSSYFEKIMAWILKIINVLLLQEITQRENINFTLSRVTIKSKVSLINAFNWRKWYKLNQEKRTMLI